MSIRIYIVEDHPLVRRGWRLLLSLEPDFDVCGEVETQAQAFAQMRALQPDVAIVDLRLKEGNGLDLIPQLRAGCPRLKIVVFSMHGERFRVDQTLRAGADAFVLKEEGTVKVIRAIRQICGGEGQAAGP
jgi:DNA-binding NarL/FixJ family response regulator